MATLGADPELVRAVRGQRARTGTASTPSRALFLNHVLINPPIDRDKAVHEVEDVYVHVVEERDDGIIVSGAKMLATGSAITHATFVAQNSAVQLEEGKAEDYALVFIAPMDTPGKKLICRARTSRTRDRRGTTRCRAASTRTTPSCVFDDAFIPWENVLVYRDVEKATGFYAAVGLHAALQAAVRARGWR